MANLWTGVVQANAEYQDLSTLSSITFEEGTSYQIQCLNPCIVREGTVGGGFTIDNTKPFEFVAKGDDLYIKVSRNSCTVNIAN